MKFGPTGSGVARRAHFPWSPCGGAVGPGSATDKVSRGRRREHRGGGGNMPDNVAVVRAHPSDGSTVRGKKGGGSSMLQGDSGVWWLGRAAMRSCTWRRRRGR
jgi:hypothetical protein